MSLKLILIFLIEFLSSEYYRSKIKEINKTKYYLFQFLNN